MEAVHEQLSLEHRQWLEEMQEAASAVGRLEAELARYPRERGGDTTLA